MAIGPMQLIAIGFDPTDRCQRRIRRELHELQGRGVIRVVDLLVVNKDLQGTITRLESSQPSNDPLVLSGQVLGILIGLDTHDSAISPSTNVSALAFAEQNYGISRKDIMGIVERLAPGKAAALLLIEHQWAIRLKAAVRAADGRMLAHSLVTPEALLWVGDQVQASADAEAAIELTSALEGAVLLEILAHADESTLTDERASAVDPAGVPAVTSRTAAAAQAIRALIVGGLIAEAAAQEAIGVLVDAGLIAEAVVTEAARRAEQTAIETQAAIISVEELAQGQLP